MLVDKIYELIGSKRGNTRTTNKTEPFVLRMSPPRFMPNSNKKSIIPSIRLEGVRSTGSEVKVRSKVKYWSDNISTMDNFKIGRQVIKSLGLDYELEGVDTIHHESYMSEVYSYSRIQRTYLLDSDGYIVAIVRSVAHDLSIDPTEVQVWFDDSGIRREVYVTELSEVRELLEDIVSSDSVESITSWKSRRDQPDAYGVKEYDIYGGRLNGAR